MSFITTPDVAVRLSLAWLRESAASLQGPALVALIYFLGAEAAFYIGTLSDQIFALFWPPNVVLFCALLIAPDGWLVVKLKTRYGESDDVAVADRFIQGIHVAAAGEAGADPYDVERIVERFGEKWDDPSNVIRATWVWAQLAAATTVRRSLPSGRTIC